MATAQGTDDEFYELLAHGREARTIPAGEVIFRQGDTADGMCVVREGTVSLTEGDRVLETVAAPGLFGEMALIEDAPRALSAVAQSDVVLVEIPTRHFWILVHDTPYFAQMVMRVMSQRLRNRGFPN